jgi:hypothetical protein
VRIEQLHLQYDRLSRHYDAALTTKDEISFLDLAHALRIWVDMKTEVARVAEERGLDLALSHHTPPKFVKRSLQGAAHSYVPLASGVDSPGVQIKGVRITNRALTPDEIAKRAAIGPPTAPISRMSFSEWMAAGVIEVPSGDIDHPHLQISREMIVKRVANVLGASHPAGMENKDPLENRFDQHIEQLHRMRVANGIPATYYQLLEIAGEILAKTKRLRETTT